MMPHGMQSLHLLWHVLLLLLFHPPPWVLAPPATAFSSLGLLLLGPLPQLCQKEKKEKTRTRTRTRSGSNHTWKIITITIKARPAAAAMGASFQKLFSSRSAIGYVKVPVSTTLPVFLSSCLPPTTSLQKTHKQTNKQTQKQTRWVECCHNSLENSGFTQNPKSCSHQHQHQQPITTT